MKTNLKKGLELMSGVLAVLSLMYLGNLVAGHIGFTGVILATATLAWADSNLASSPRKRGNPSKIAGAAPSAIALTWEKAAADGDGTIYYLAEVSANAVLKDLLLNNDALTGLSDLDCGFYKLPADGGAPTDDAVSGGTSGKDVLLNGEDVAAGQAMSSEQNLLEDMNVDKIGKKVWELLGYTKSGTYPDKFVLALTLNTAGSAAGTMSVRGSWIQG